MSGQAITNTTSRDLILVVRPIGHSKLPLSSPQHCKCTANLGHKGDNTRQKKNMVSPSPPYLWKPSIAASAVEPNIVSSTIRVLENHIREKILEYISNLLPQNFVFAFPAGRWSNCLASIYAEEPFKEEEMWLNCAPSWRTRSWISQDGSVPFLVLMPSGIKSFRFAESMMSKTQHSSTFLFCSSLLLRVTPHAEVFSDSHRLPFSPPVFANIIELRESSDVMNELRHRSSEKKTRRPSSFKRAPANTRETIVPLLGNRHPAVKSSFLSSS